MHRAEASPGARRFRSSENPVGVLGVRGAPRLRLRPPLPPRSPVGSRSSPEPPPGSGSRSRSACRSRRRDRPRRRDDAAPPCEPAPRRHRPRLADRVDCRRERRVTPHSRQRPRGSATSTSSSTSRPRRSAPLLGPTSATSTGFTPSSHAARSSSPRGGRYWSSRASQRPRLRRLEDHRLRRRDDVAFSSVKAAPAHQVRLLRRTRPHGIPVNTVHPDAVVRGSACSPATRAQEWLTASSCRVAELGRFYAGARFLKTEILPEHVTDAVQSLIRRRPYVQPARSFPSTAASHRLPRD